MSHRFFFLAALAVALPAAVAAPLTVAVTDMAGKPVEGAVVAVSVAGAPTSSHGATAQVAQEGRQFVPQVTVVQTGTAITFPNRDVVRHHVYSFSAAKAFELKLYAGNPSTPVVFDKAGTAVLGCNIHDKMAAWVVVVDTPYFGKTDAAGQVKIDIPEGEHRMRVWHARQAEAPVVVEQKVRAGTPAVVRIAALPDA